MSCAENFARFQSPVQAIDLAEAIDPSKTLDRAIYDTAVNSFDFVSMKLQDFFSDNLELMWPLRREKKLLDSLIFYPANFPINLLCRGYRSAKTRTVLIWKRLSIKWTGKHSGRFCRSLVGLIRSGHDDMKDWTCVGGELLDPISTEAGLKQRDLLVLTFLWSSLLWSF